MKTKTYTVVQKIDGQHWPCNDLDQVEECLAEHGLSDGEYSLFAGAPIAVSHKLVIESARRPRKAKTATTQTAAGSVTRIARAGRPKGSKNKPKDAPDANGHTVEA